MSVRSETPTSFFFVLSNTAFLTLGLPPPPLAPAGAATVATLLLPARFVTPCFHVRYILRRPSGSGSVALRAYHGKVVYLELFAHV